MLEPEQSKSQTTTHLVRRRLAISVEFIRDNSLNSKYVECIGYVQYKDT